MIAGEVKTGSGSIARSSRENREATGNTTPIR